MFRVFRGYDSSCEMPGAARIAEPLTCIIDLIQCVNWLLGPQLSMGRKRPESFVAGERELKTRLNLRRDAKAHADLKAMQGSWRQIKRFQGVNINVVRKATSPSWWR